MQFHNAIYVNDEHTCFDVDVTLDDNTQIPYTFTIGGYDDAPISMAIKEALDRGEIQIADYVPPVIPDEVLAFDIRDKRNALLSATDYLLQPDYPISDTDREAVKAYRQALRDITNQEGFPKEVVWPEKPDV